jgi:hypothetical protein
MIVGAIEKHWTSHDGDGAERSQRRSHDDGESARAAAVGDDESVEEKRCEFFPYWLF